MKIQATIVTSKPINTDLAATSGGGNASYALVKPAFYRAVVTGIEAKNYSGRDGQGYMAITPSVVLLNDASTEISRQSYTVGATDKSGAIVALKEGKSPVWGGEQGALFLLVSLGVIEGSGTNLQINADTDYISDRVVVVQTGIGAYVKGGRNWSPSDVVDIVKAIYGEDWITAVYAEADPAGCITEAIRTIENETGDIKLKNVIRGWFKVSKEEVTENGWYSPDGKQVFVNEVAYQSYLDLLEDGVDNNAAGW